jgi:flagellar assembly factor FliW
MTVTDLPETATRSSLTDTALLPRSTDAMSAQSAEMTAVATGPVHLPTVTLASELPGLPGLRHFVLVRLDEEGMLLSLRSLDADGIRFVVVPSVAFFPDYAPEIDDATVSALGLLTADDALVLLILTVGSSLRSSTANLRAPLVVNRHTLAAAQAVLTDEYPIQAPLIEA